MYYELRGDGFPVVMIMGLGANVYWWDPILLDDLSEKFTILIFDNRGAGRTDKPQIDYSIKMFADDTASLMSALSIEKAHIIGVSMGGMIAQELAINYPEKVEKLVLCVTHPGGSKAIPPAPEVLQKLIVDRTSITKEEIAKHTMELLFPDDFLKNNPFMADIILRRLLKFMIPPDAFTRQLNAILNFDAYKRLENIKAPTLVVAAGRDVLVPPENSRLIVEKIPNSRLVTFERSGHGLIVQERDRFEELVFEFLLNSE
jgi:pimeloyl-ACP methyl ester carboxylesterase